MAVVTGGAKPLVLIDGSQLFAARAALTYLAAAEHRFSGASGAAGAGRGRGCR